MTIKAVSSTTKSTAATKPWKKIDCQLPPVEGGPATATGVSVARMEVTGVSASLVGLGVRVGVSVGVAVEVGVWVGVGVGVWVGVEVGVSVGVEVGVLVGVGLGV
jgi:hypothetical protein